MDTFTVLAQPQRRLILDVLIDGERPVGELVEELGLSQPVVSKQLRILREADMVAVRIDAQRRLYRINPKPLAEIDAWLDRGAAEGNCDSGLGRRGGGLAHDGFVFDGGQTAEADLAASAVVGAFDPGDDRDP